MVLYFAGGREIGSVQYGFGFGFGYGYGYLSDTVPTPAREVGMGWMWVIWG